MYKAIAAKMIALMMIPAMFFSWFVPFDLLPI
jgi:hypothetical protein